MSSSKIQEYNLDPNMGLAKEESVQEVKNVSDEIKALIGTEIATQLSTLKTDIISAISSNSGGSIKAVYSGVIDYYASDFNETITAYKDITLPASIDTTKSFYIVNGYACYSTHSNTLISEGTTSLVARLYSNKIRVAPFDCLDYSDNSGTNTATIYGTYQVIEFN